MVNKVLYLRHRGRHKHMATSWRARSGWYPQSLACPGAGIFCFALEPL